MFTVEQPNQKRGPTKPKLWMWRGNAPSKEIVIHLKTPDKTVFYLLKHFNISWG